MNTGVRASRRIDLYQNVAVVATWTYAVALDRLSIVLRQGYEVGIGGPALH
jgi:hypothetical protein